MKVKKLAQVISLICVAGPAWAQQAAPASPPQPQKIEKVIITGSSIKRVESEGALPVQVITREEIDRQGIMSAEQLIATISANGNGMDNLASNADVVAGQDRGNNGASAANLRGQGSQATLVLLNGRRVAAHGLNGGVVDLNSIPFTAVERVEILKDGASAVYGADAVGGVINFILRKDYQGIRLEAFVDKTQDGGGDINRLSLIAGFGDLAKDRYNVMATLSHSENKILRGDQRDFVNTFQSNRGLSPDTRGTPFATVFPLGSNNAGVLQTILTSRATPGGALSNTLSPFIPGTTTRANGGINALNVPGGAGCNSIDGQAPYDYNLWISPPAQYACAWDTGRAAALQQPVKNTNFVGRGTFNMGNHTLFAEVTGARVETAKEFSPNQISSSTTTTNPFYNLVYPLNALTKPTYDAVFNAIAATFPSIQENYGKGIAYRWRCMICGNRELKTTSDTARFLIGAEGLIGSWEYRAGLSKAYSDTYSIVGKGYFFNDLFVPALASGVINPFLAPGQAPSAESVAAYNAASAQGVKLYGGRFDLTQADASISGSVYHLPAGDIMMAVGTDLRTEKWKFQGDERDLANQRAIFNVPFDNGNALSGVKRDIHAFYAEFQIPLAKEFEVSLAARNDHYTGFGGTTNPKVTFRYTPIEQLLFRGSWGTGFRVPTFNQLFNGVSDSTTSGTNIYDPATCAQKVTSSTVPGCAPINPNTLFGGVATLGPEKSEQSTVGLVWAPVPEFSTNIDYWNILRNDRIQALPLATFLDNYNLFAGRFIRDAGGVLRYVDISWINAGSAKTHGFDVGARLNGALGSGRYFASIDGTYLTKKITKLTQNTLYGPSEIGQFTRSGDLGIRWKHSAAFTYTEGDWSSTLTQRYVAGYKDAVLPGVANGTVSPKDWVSDVDSYSIYNISVTYSGFKKLRLTAGVRNIFNTDPPFSAVYDTNTGAGSSWEPRVGDPRGRSYTFLAAYDFK